MSRRCWLALALLCAESACSGGPASRAGEVREGAASMAAVSGRGGAPGAGANAAGASPEPNAGAQADSSAGAGPTALGTRDAAIPADASARGEVDAALSPADAATTPDAAFAPAAGLMLQVSSGTLEGQQVGATREFLGVPYAEPPVAALRFAAPRPVRPWTGIHNATRFGPSCMQGGAELGLDTG